MITEEEKKEIIEWVSGLTDPQTVHHIKIFKNTIEDKPFYLDDLSNEEKNRIDLGYPEGFKDKDTEVGRIHLLKKFREPVKDSF